MKSISLTQNELEIMELLWRENRPLSRSEILDLSTGRSWQASSIHILLNKLLEKEVICVKGFVKTGKNYGRTYSANVTPEEYIVATLKHNSYYNDSKETVIISIFSALIQDDDIGEDILGKLEEMIAERRARLKK